MQLKIFKRLSHSYSLSLAPIPLSIYNSFVGDCLRKVILIKDIFHSTNLFKQIYFIIGLKSHKDFQKVIALDIKKHNNTSFCWSSTQTYENKFKTTFEVI